MIPAMIDGKPNYTRLSTIAMADVVLMDPDGRMQFINALCEMFDHILDPDYQPEEGSGFVGRAIQRQFDEFREGTRKYMDNVNRNPSGLANREKNPQGNPLGNPLGKNAETPKEIEQEIEIETEPEKKKKKIFTPPSVEEVRQYCQERGNGIDPEYFVDYYQTRGWILKNGQRMKDWRAAIRSTWEKNQKGGGNNGGYPGHQAEPGAAHRPDYSFLRDRSDST